MTKNLNEMLGIDKLDEEKQTEITNYINEMVDLKAQELLEEKKQELKDELTESYETKFNEYKDEITSKFSNFVDDILEQEIYIPESVQEYARKGELYEEVMEKLKITMAIDEDVLNDEVKDILKEAKSEILTLKEKVNSLISEKNELKEDAVSLSANIYLRDKCDGLSESKKKSIMSLLEDVTDPKEIDKKFDILVNETFVNEETMECPNCGTKIEFDKESPETCPECGHDLTEKENGRGKEEANESFNKVNEDSPMATWKKILTEKVW